MKKVILMLAIVVTSMCTLKAQSKNNLDKLLNKYAGKYVEFPQRYNSVDSNSAVILKTNGTLIVKFPDKTDSVTVDYCKKNYPTRGDIAFFDSDLKTWLSIKRTRKYLYGIYYSKSLSDTKTYIMGINATKIN